jgi:ClpX C4-type zinc finger
VIVTVRAAGRGVRDDRTANVMRCSFCHRDARYVAEGPGVNICDACLTKALDAPAQVDQCSFCNNNGKIALTSTDAQICAECLLIAEPVVQHLRQRDKRSR